MFEVFIVILQVNENFSQTLVNELPPIEVKQRVIACDGGNCLLQDEFHILSFTYVYYQ